MTDSCSKHARSGPALNKAKEESKKATAACEVCAWAPPAFVRRRVMEVHHVHPVTFGGTSSGFNLVVICPNCHELAHAIWPTRAQTYEGPRERNQFIRVMRQVISNPELWRVRNLGGRGLDVLADSEMTTDWPSKIKKGSE